MIVRNSNDERLLQSEDWLGSEVVIGCVSQGSKLHLEQFQDIVKNIFFIVVILIISLKHPWYPHPNYAVWMMTMINWGWHEETGRMGRARPVWQRRSHCLTPTGLNRPTIIIAIIIPATIIVVIIKWCYQKMNVPCLMVDGRER